MTNAVLTVSFYIAGLLSYGPKEDGPYIVLCCDKALTFTAVLALPWLNQNG